MQHQFPEDVTSLQIRLNEMKSNLNNALRTGSDLETIRGTYQQINELQCHLTALQWTPKNAVNNNDRFGQERQRFSGEPAA